MPTDLILGTAGHIDHGKTSLIRALTGTDTDRLPEEKKRGITIELGFAHLDIGDFRLGVVDVPGHEKFVRNMLAGATGMDLALLVVAADDSVKQQTREHLEILRLLDLPSGVIALTKIDMVDADWAELVAEEVRELTRGTFLEKAPIIPTSSHTGIGLDELRAALESAAKASAEVRRGAQSGQFRMAIDRTFTIAGHGTVVTGSVSRGEAKVGDQLELQPGNVEVRVRGIQNHDASVDEIRRGQRAAINLAGVHHGEVLRGQELATPGHLKPTRLVTARMTVLPGAVRALKNRSRVRVHVGAAEISATVLILDKKELATGETGFVQFFLSSEAVMTWNQPYVVRSESPVTTVGGGRVLHPNADKLRNPSASILAQLGDLESPDVLQRAAAGAYFAGLEPWSPEDLVRIVGLDDPRTVYQQLVEDGVVVEQAVSPTRSIRIHRQCIAEWSERIASVLRSLHEQNPLRSMLDYQQLLHRFSNVPRELLELILQSMLRAKTIRRNDHQVALVGCGPTLSQNEQKLLNQLVDTYRSAGFESPTVKQVQAKVTKNQSAVPQLVKLAAANGDLIEVASDYYLHRDVEWEYKERLANELRKGEGLTLSQIREMLATSRKYAVPFCEYLDRTGFTRRENDLRFLAEPNGKNDLEVENESENHTV
ncbi:MAG: selenocysteine-specific elongation factor [Pirellulaceae bacterium]|jgi:selenocysteine-specific elongation factor